MTVPSSINRNDYIGNDSTDTYSYTFRIFDNTDLTLIIKDTNNDTETTLVLDTDYTVSGAGGAGGSITLISAGQDWISGGGNLNTGYNLVIRRVVDITQETDIRNQGAFFPELHEDQFDKTIMIAQQQQEELNRSVKLPESLEVSNFDPTLPVEIADNPNVAILVNSTGDGLRIGPTADEIENAQAYALLAQDWAVKIDGIVDTTDYSSKAWAIGGTDVTDTAGKGAAKEWAVKTGSTVDTVDYSAKEYAQGVTPAVGGSSKDWASKTDAVVPGTSEYSSKEYAQGVQAGTGGSAKDWAIETASDVDSTGEYSSKENAIGTQTRGLAGGGSSKDWARYIGGTVDDTEYSAKKYANDAAQSASDAAASASASQWADVAFVSFADSPVAITDASAGTLYAVDTTGGPVVFNLPEISTLTLSQVWSIGIKKTVASANNITINPFGTEEIDGSNSAVVISRQNAGRTLIPDADPTPDAWTTIEFGEIPINGDIVGTTDAQTLTNKTFDDAITMQELSATPSNPAAGYQKIYMKDDGKFYRLENDGTETEVGAGAGGSGGGTGLNFVSSPDSDFENIDSIDETTWSTYDDGAVASPTNGAGPVAGIIDLALSGDTTTYRVRQFVYNSSSTISSANPKGQTFETVIAGTLTKVRFPLTVASAITGSLKVELYSVSGTNPTDWLPNTLLATAQEYDVSNLTAGGATDWVDFVFDTPFSLSANTGYAILISEGASVLSSSVGVRKEGTLVSPYPRGSALLNASTIDTNRDLAFDFIIETGDEYEYVGYYPAITNTNTIANTATWKSQSFTVYNSGDIKTAAFRCRIDGATGTMVAKIYSASGTNPNVQPGSLLGTSDAFDVSTAIGWTSGDRINFNFSTPVAVTPGEYCIVLDTTNVTSFGSVFQWIVSTSLGYTDGNVALTGNSGGTWSINASFDAWFEVGIDVAAEEALNGTQSALFRKLDGNAQGSGAKLATIPVPLGYQGEPLKIKGVFETLNAYKDNDLRLFWYDETNGDTPKAIQNSDDGYLKAGKNYVEGLIYPKVNTASISILAHTASTNEMLYDIKVDDVGLVFEPRIAIQSNIKQYSEIVGGSSVGLNTDVTQALDLNTDTGLFTYASGIYTFQKDCIVHASASFQGNDSLPVIIRNGTTIAGDRVATSFGSASWSGEIAAGDTLKFRNGTGSAVSGTVNVYMMAQYIGDTVDTLAINSGLAILNAELSGAQSIPNATQTKVNFDVINLDTRSSWDSANYRFIADRDSTYKATASAAFGSGAATLRGLAIRKNGVEIKAAGYKGDASYSALSNIVTAILDLVKGDYLEMFVYQDSGGSLNLASSTRTFFDVEELRSSQTSLVSGTVYIGQEVWSTDQPNSTTTVSLYKSGNLLKAIGKTVFNGGFTGSEYTVTIPSTYTMDGNQIDYTTVSQNLGTITMHDTGITIYDGFVFATGANQFKGYCILSSGSYSSLQQPTSTIPFSWVSGDAITWKLEWPVQGW